MSTTPQTWIATNQLYGQPISITALAYANGTYLALVDNHLDGSKCFETVIVSRDLSHWDHKPSSPTFDFEFKNVKITSHEDYFIAVATKSNEFGDKFISLISYNGFDWNLVFETEDSSENYSPLKLTYTNGMHIACCMGCMFLSSTGKIWTKITLPEPYTTARVLGSAMAAGKIYFLLDVGSKSYLAITENGNSFTVIPTPWNMKTVGIAGNNNQVLVSASIQNKACVIYFSDDLEAYGIRSLPEVPYDDNFLTVQDMKYINNEWILACNREFFNTTGIKFSVHNFIYRVKDSLNEDSELIIDVSPSKNINTIEFLNNQVVGYGQVSPNPENCLYVVEQT